MPDRGMYEAANAFCRAELWKLLYDDDLYAVRFPDDTTGYCCVMGHVGEHFALAVYLGMAGLSTYYTLQHLPEEADPLHVFEAMHGQDCLSCSYETKKLLESEDLQEMETLSVAPPARGKWPRFRRYRPGKVEWFLEDPTEGEQLRLALAAGVALRGYIDQAVSETGGLKDAAHREETLAALGFTSHTVPLLLPQADGGFLLEVEELPEDVPVRYLSPSLEEPFLLARLKKQKTLPEVVWVVDVMMLPAPVEGTPPFFPTAMLLLDTQRGFLDAAMVADFQEEGPQLLDKLIDRLLEEGKPSMLLTDNPRTYYLLKGLAEQIQLPLSLEDELPGMAGIRQEFMEFLMQGDTPPEPSGP